MPDFKDMLKYFRLREGLSQSELAEKLQVSTSRISMYEAGKREPDFITEERIADFFNTDLNTLRGKDSERLHKQSKKLTLAISLFETLNDKAQDMAIENMKLLQKVYPRIEEPLLNAAHERTDIEVTEEMRKHDEDIMDDDDF